MEFWSSKLLALKFNRFWLITTNYTVYYKWLYGVHIMESHSWIIQNDDFKWSKRFDEKKRCAYPNLGFLNR